MVEKNIKLRILFYRKYEIYRKVYVYLCVVDLQNYFETITNKYIFMLKKLANY